MATPQETPRFTAADVARTIHTHADQLEEHVSEESMDPDSPHDLADAVRSLALWLYEIENWSGTPRHEPALDAAWDAMSRGPGRTLREALDALPTLALACEAAAVEPERPVVGGDSAERWCRGQVAIWAGRIRKVADEIAGGEVYPPETTSTGSQRSFAVRRPIQALGAQPGDHLSLRPGRAHPVAVLTFHEPWALKVVTTELGVGVTCLTGAEDPTACGGCPLADACPERSIAAGTSSAPRLQIVT